MVFSVGFGGATGGSSVRHKTPDLRCQERVAVESIGLDADTLGTSTYGINLH